MTNDHSPDPAPKRGRGRPRLDAEMVPRILDAAELLFSQCGLSGVSIRDIAAQADIPHSAIYRYFEGKDEIVRQVIVRGQERQADREAVTRAEGDTISGAMKWFVENNRALALAEIHAALEGHTLSSLGIPSQARQRTLQVLDDRAYEFTPCPEIEPRIAYAAATALAIGWAALEDWIIDAAGLQDRDVDQVRSDLDCILAALMAMGQNGVRTPRDD